MALKSSGIPSVLEPVGLNRGDGTRPDGITIFPFSQGRALCWDAMCVNTFNESSVNDTAIKLGQAVAKTEKIQKGQIS